MFTVKGKHWIRRNGVPQEPAPDKTFTSAMDMLRWAVESGMIRRGSLWGNTTPGVDELERVSVPYAGSSDWGGDYYFTPEQVEAMSAALREYRAELHHKREIEPEWREVGRTHYADNSVEVRQRDKHGNERTVMETAPHGDVCF